MTVLDVAGLRSAASVLDRLRLEGWAIRDELDTVRLTIGTDGTVQALTTACAEISAAIHNMEVVGTSNGHVLRLRRTGAELEVVDVPEVSPEDLFDDPKTVSAARRAWDRDRSAALSLPLEWTISIDLTLDRLLVPVAQLDFRVCVAARTINEAFLGASLLELNRLVPQQPARRRVYIALDSDDDGVHLGHVSFVGLRADTDILVPAAAAPASGERELLQARQLVPAPYTLLSEDLPTGTWKDVASQLRSQAAVATWALLSTRTLTTDQGIQADFLGFKRLSILLPASHDLKSQDVSDTLALGRWAFREASPDRILAVRQVVSLYADSKLWQSAADVEQGAEVIYVGLRSEAVAEVVRSSREANLQAHEVARQTLKTSQEMTKAATERGLGALIAVGAVLMANASRVLSEDLGRLLLLIVAAFLIVLALLFIVVEGPQLSLPLKHLRSSLRSSFRLLTDQQREEVLFQPGVLATCASITSVRWLVPLLYLLFAAGIVIWGRPSYFI